MSIRLGQVVPPKHTDPKALRPAVQGGLAKELYLQDPEDPEDPEVEVHPCSCCLRPHRRGGAALLLFTFLYGSDSHSLPQAHGPKPQGPLPMPLEGPESPGIFSADKSPACPTAQALGDTMFGNDPKGGEMASCEI